tara:strand:- start:940 stop:2157 length:1218 start_codon:yes stop_codon:yes gene_type:complete
MNTRRTFLKTMGATGVALGTLPHPVFGRTAVPDPDGRILVLVQLAGGNDGLNTVIPFANDVYQKRRPSLALGKGAVLSVNDELGLHPQLSGLKEIYDDGALGIVQGVGYPNPNRSHFRSMDIWHTARPGVADKRDGWLGRAFDSAAKQLAGQVPAIALGTGRLPLGLVSTKFTVPTVRSLKDYQLQLDGSKAEQTAQRRRMRELVGSGTGGNSDLDFLRRTAATALDTSAKIQSVLEEYQPAQPYPENGLGQRLKNVAQLITADLGARVYFVSLDGFDTHAEQEGAHNALMTELSTALSAFRADLKAHGLAKRVLTATFSEFGRRVKENGSLGTDHGAAGPMFLMGGTVKAGLHGAHPSLTDLDQGDLKHHTDFRSIYTTLLEDWLGWDAKAAVGGEFKKPALLT